MKIAQYRYNHSSANNITPEQLANVDETTESPLIGKNIVQFGIQGPSGLRFCLNGNETAELVVGASGVYELNVNGFTTVTSITFPQFNTIKYSDKDLPTGPITIDILYWEGEE